MSVSLCYSASRSGYGLVVKRVLAKDESGVRFSLSAPINSDTKDGQKWPSFVLGTTGDKSVNSGDKRHENSPLSQ